jgi:uncharacterized membrane protein YecN with MAPEG domain
LKNQFLEGEKMKNLLESLIVVLIGSALVWMVFMIGSFHNRSIGLHEPTDPKENITFEVTQPATFVFESSEYFELADSAGNITRAEMLPAPEGKSEPYFKRELNLTAGKYIIQAGDVKNMYSLENTVISWRFSPLDRVWFTFLAFVVAFLLLFLFLG